MYIDQAKEVLRIEAEGVNALIDQLGPDFNKAIDMIMACPGRVIITGIGKSGIIGQKIAATLNSTGTSSFFLHPVEAMHGWQSLDDLCRRGVLPQLRTFLCRSGDHWQILVLGIVAGN